MPDNDESTNEPTTELPPVALAAVAPTTPVVVEQPSGHSNTRVLLAAGAGALVVFLIAAAGILGYVVGSHSNDEGGDRPARFAQMQDNFRDQYEQRGPGMGRGPGWMWHQQGEQGQQGMPPFPGQQGQGPGGMMGQVPTQ
ncbi:MAG: hypothetical protein Q7K25_11480 [Actinomycetota bacterium]|nr:hypothetical protein [Actinomycetota bacterium]